VRWVSVPHLPRDGDRRRLPRPRVSVLQLSLVHRYLVFLVIYERLTGAHVFEPSHVGALLVEEAVGGVLLGIGLGWLTNQLLRSIDNDQVEVLLTLDW
jgi:hypothetical protein